MKTTRPRHAGDPHPQPLAQSGGVIEPEYQREREQLDAAREWLRHVEAGRIGGSAERREQSRNDDGPDDDSVRDAPSARRND